MQEIRKAKRKVYTYGEEGAYVLLKKAEFHCIFATKRNKIRYKTTFPKKIKKMQKRG